MQTERSNFHGFLTKMLGPNKGGNRMNSHGKVNSQRYELRNTLQQSHLKTSNVGPENVKCCCEEGLALADETMSHQTWQRSNGFAIAMSSIR